MRQYTVTFAKSFVIGFVVSFIIGFVKSARREPQFNLKFRPFDNMF